MILQTQLLFPKLALAAATGFGFFLIYKKYRTQIWRQINSIVNYNDPLRNQEIKVVSSEEECQYLMHKLKRHCDEYNVLGFACEWVRAGRVRQPVALLQLTSYNGLCTLVRLSQMSSIPSEVKEILEDNHILKVGVAADADANYLAQDRGIHVASTFDLRYMATMAGCQPSNLADMASEYLDVKLERDSRIRSSDWEAPELNDRQIDYAAKDAHVAVELFKYFAEKLKPRRTFENPSSYIKGIINDYCLRYFDFNFNHTTRTKSVSFDGVEETESHAHERQELTIEENQCVVCGRSDTHHRKHIVPLEYQNYFPPETKMSNDTVSLCLACSQISKIYDSQLRERLAGQCNAPFARKNAPSVEVPRLKERRSICRELYYQYDEIPKARRNELFARLKELCPEHNDFDRTFLKSNVDIQIVESDENQNTHAAKVVEYYKKSKKGLVGLQRQWLEQFMKRMRPKYMPNRLKAD